MAVEEIIKVKLDAKEAERGYKRLGEKGKKSATGQGLDHVSA